MKSIDRRKRILLTCALLTVSALAASCTLFNAKELIPPAETISRDRPFSLTQPEVSKLGDEAENGNCAAAYRLAQYHLYASLELPQAEKYFRLAARCDNPDALAGLITVLRRPENDAEIDELVLALRQLDRKKGDSAAEEVALRRAERASK